MLRRRRRLKGSPLHCQLSAAPIRGCSRLDHVTWGIFWNWRAFWKLWAVASVQIIVVETALGSAHREATKIQKATSYEPFTSKATPLNFPTRCGSSTRVRRNTVLHVGHSGTVYLGVRGCKEEAQRSLLIPVIMRYIQVPSNKLHAGRTLTGSYVDPYRSCARQDTKRGR